jgi:hypothetical protein
MIEHNFGGFDRSETAGFSDSQFEFIVETLQGATGNGFLARNRLGKSSL